MQIPYINAVTEQVHKSARGAILLAKVRPESRVLCQHILKRCAGGCSSHRHFRLAVNVSAESGGYFQRWHGMILPHPCDKWTICLTLDREIMSIPGIFHGSLDVGLLIVPVQPVLKPIHALE